MKKSRIKIGGIVLTLLLALITLGGIKNVSAEGEAPDKLSMSLEMDFHRMGVDGGHAYPGIPGRLVPEADEMWQNLPITVEDEAGHKVEVPKEFLPNTFMRAAGEWIDGETLTITIEPEGILDEYHISWDERYEYPSPTRYYQFKATFHKERPTIRIQFGYMDVKFDLQGGNIDGNTDPIIHRVKKDNSVEFPADPVKDNLQFSGWYTKRPTENKGNPVSDPGKVYYWTQESGFSDYDRDWLLWNDQKVDPLYDDVFLLRAEWSANVTFDANDGSFDAAGEEKTRTVQVKEGEAVSNPEAPKKPLAEFVSWQTEDGKDYDFGAPVTGNLVLKAKWNDYAKPEVQDVTVKKGGEVNPEDFIQNVPDLPESTKITFKEDPDTSTVGTHDVVIEVVYPNGEKIEVTGKLSVVSADTPVINPPVNPGTEDPQKPKPGETDNPQKPKPGETDDPQKPKPGEIDDPQTPNPDDHGKTENPTTDDTGNTQEPGTVNSVPELEVSDKIITQGSELDLKDLVVSATDAEDGDLKDQVVIADDGGFDPDKTGTYIITIRVSDQDGASVSKQATVVVAAKQAPAEKKNQKPTQTKQEVAPKTGDEAAIAGYALLIGLSGALFASTVRKKRTKAN